MAIPGRVGGAGAEAPGVSARLNKLDFVYYLPTKRFVYLATEQVWVKAGVIKVLGSEEDARWVQEHRAVTELPFPIYKYQYPKVNRPRKRPKTRRQ
jgi:hypothetical protein